MTITIRQSLAAFTPPTFRPPHVNQINYYHDLLYPTYQCSGTFMACSTRYSHSHMNNSVRGFYASLHDSNAFFSTSLFGSSSNNIDTSSVTNANPQLDKQTTRIGIIGGGIAGVTAANALSNIFANDHDSMNAKIIVFEGHEEALSPIDLNECEQPQWTAATARNANTLAFGASMHIMSQRSTLFKIAKDVTREWYIEQVESIQHWLQAKGYFGNRMMKINSTSNFDVVPPYFALHLLRCVGPSATNDERATFVTFLKHFMLTSLFTGEAEANQRGQIMMQLAKASRASFLNTINNDKDDRKALAEKIGLGKGFLSLHRTSDFAIRAFKEGQLFGEACHIMSYKQACELEPRIANLPISNNLEAVHRVDDYTANSSLYIQDLIDKIKGKGVEYRSGSVGMIDDISQVEVVNHQLASGSKQQHPQFIVTTSDGLTHDFDYIVLAAGVNTPLIARKLGIAKYCPTYPLRGYSLTIYTNHAKDTESGNLLNMPFSIDDMYCSSVSQNMARIAGFGELVGYRDKAVNVPSLAPMVMARYAKSLFPESDACEQNALQCFRPCSPDDLPIVGEVRTSPGVFMHTGHGTLGWTISHATSECLAQAMYDRIKGNESRRTYYLSDGIQVDANRLSPNRFL